MELSTRQRTAIANALQVARLQYLADELNCRATPGHDRMADQFKSQAEDAKELQELFE